MQSNVKKIVEQAIYPNEKKERHQFRIPVCVLNKYMAELNKSDKAIVNAKNFDELLDITENHSIKGIGKLTEYDTAFRIGEQIGIFPDKVYLHAGTRVGALKLKLILKGSRKKYLTLDELPPWLRKIKPYETEDFLCECKDAPTEANLKRYMQNRRACAGGTSVSVCHPSKKTDGGC